MDKGLVLYSDSDEENDDLIADKISVQPRDNANITPSEENERSKTKPDRKRKFSDQDKNQELNNTSQKLKSKSLPVPSEIQALYQDLEDSSETADDSSKHDGRRRTFSHMEGNWATFVYVPYPSDARVGHLIGQLLSCLQPMKFHRMDDLHLTLSRTVVIRHHWIQPLMDSIKEKFETLESCICDIVSLKLFSNDEKSRTFLSLEVSDDNSNLPEYIAAVDSSFKDFRLAPYYKNPSFHVSIAWCLGDVTADVSSQTVSQMQVILQKYLEDNPDLSVLEVSQVECKTGNKVYTFKVSKK
ncbi:U6 snRNA phosphodiesterase-like [Gigantopelta aegis]|uniref:U6 snRNA phosphodiesterase-like n=1 Tax=Gigantopelta aegis TaxID=1735272 RepID=UPI001B88C6E9|nr:U6 snRNA phosphodiesterase-like [Gigantopelta aegis]